MKLWWEANLTRILLWWPQANANKEVSIKICASFFYSVFSHQNTLNGQLHAFTHPSINNRSNGSNNSTSPLMWKFVRGDSRCTWPWPPKERESGQVILFGTLNNSDFEKMKGESEMFLKKNICMLLKTLNSTAPCALKHKIAQRYLGENIV